MNLIGISQELLRASKSSNTLTPIMNQLEKKNLNDLTKELDSDAKRKAFWINIYNAFCIIYLKPNPNIILQSIPRKLFFSKKRIQIGDCLLSLNDVEHQILRKSKVWRGKGYLTNPLSISYIKQLQVKFFDERVHFALNCGGAGCPPIRFYDSKTIDEELDSATRAFLYSEAELSSDKKEVKISKLFSWYKGDFGGNRGILSFLEKYNIISNTERPKIVYSPYNWEPWIK